MTEPIDYTPEAPEVDFLPAPAVPHSREAEEAVIGALIINPEVFHECRLELPGGGEEFYIHRHRFIWDAAEVIVKAGEPLDLLTLANQLQAAGTLDEVGGSAYITSLINQVPSSLNAAAYSKIVHQRYVRRQMITAANTIAGLAYKDDLQLEESAGEATRALSQAVNLNTGKSTITLAESVKIVDAMIDANSQSDELPGIPTPWVDYNKLLGGGAQPTDLNIIAGRPGQGKTTALMQIGLHAAKYNADVKVQKKHVHIFSLEMPHQQLTLRLLAQLSKIDFQLLRAGKIPEDRWQDYYKAVETLEALDITIHARAGASPSWIRSVSELAFNAGRLDLICVDSLNLMRTGGNYRGREYAEADVCATELKNIAMDFNIPVWCAHQMNRGVEKREDNAKPQLSDLRDGGEQPADGVMFIWHEKDDNGKPNGTSSFLQEKQRNGPIGEVPVVFIKEFTRFESAARF